MVALLDADGDAGWEFWPFFFAFFKILTFFLLCWGARWWRCSMQMGARAGSSLSSSSLPLLLLPVPPGSTLALLTSALSLLSQLPKRCREEGLCPKKKNILHTCLLWHICLLPSSCWVGEKVSLLWQPKKELAHLHAYCCCMLTYADVC